MKITILGSGTSTGVPMVGCSCPVCTSENPRDKRTRSSILIETSGKYILVDTSTDLRKQAIRQNVPRIDAVLFTHAHADHLSAAPFLAAQTGAQTGIGVLGFSLSLCPSRPMLPARIARIPRPTTKAAAARH